VRDIRAFARYYCAMALGAETDKELELAFQDLRELKVDVAYPFLLELYHDYATGLLPRRLPGRRCAWSRPTCSAARSAPSRPTR
jgi:uncharacterized protein with ParB-like and HNH nuclease domain